MSERKNGVRGRGRAREVQLETRRNQTRMRGRVSQGERESKARGRKRLERMSKVREGG